MEVPELPVPLQACQFDPEPPDTDSQTDVAVYAGTLWGAWHDCFYTVKAQTEFWRVAKELTVHPASGAKP